MRLWAAPKTLLLEDERGDSLEVRVAHDGQIVWCARPVVRLTDPDDVVRIYTSLGVANAALVVEGERQAGARTWYFRVRQDWLWTVGL